VLIVFYIDFQLLSHFALHQPLVTIVSHLLINHISRNIVNNGLRKMTVNVNYSFFGGST